MGRGDVSPVREAAGGTETQCDHMSVNNPVWMRECVFIRVGVCGAWVSSFVVFVPSKSISLSFFPFSFFFTGWLEERRGGRCVGSEPVSAASACWASSSGLWSGGPSPNRL